MGLGELNSDMQLRSDKSASGGTHLESHGPAQLHNHMKNIMVFDMCQNIFGQDMGHFKFKGTSSLARILHV